MTLFDSTGLAIQDLAIAPARRCSKSVELDLPRAPALTLRRARRQVSRAAARLEQVEQRVAVAEDRARDEAAAGEAEHVAVPGVAARHPGAARGRAPGRPRGGSRARARRSRPSGSRRAAHARRGRRRTLDSACWTSSVTSSSSVNSRVERDVAEAAGDDPPVLRLVPVVEAVPPVVRHLEQALGERLGGDHLPPRRHDQALELAEQAARIAVRRDDDALRVGARRGPSTRGPRRSPRRPRRRARRAAARGVRAGARRRSDGGSRR